MSLIAVAKGLQEYIRIRARVAKMPVVTLRFHAEPDRAVFLARVKADGIELFKPDPKTPDAPHCCFEMYGMQFNTRVM